MLAAQQIGGWSAVWMTSLNSPTTGMHAEVDLVESYGSATYGFNHAVHVWPGRNDLSDATKTNRGGGFYPNTPVASDQSWHIYAAEMTDNWIIFYFDGQETSRVPRLPEWNDAPWRIWVNLAGGPGRHKELASGTIDMFVDYVKVYVQAPIQAPRIRQVIDESDEK